MVQVKVAKDETDCDGWVLGEAGVCADHWRQCSESCNDACGSDLCNDESALSKTKGLLLIDHADRVMELTAQDCQWRRRAKGEWQKATVGKMNGKPGYVEVLDLNRTIKGNLRIGSVLKLKMKEQEQTKSVAKLVTHCRPGERLDYMVSMYNREDLAHAGGELGHRKHRTENQVHFLSVDSKHMLNVKADSEFQARNSTKTEGTTGQLGDGSSPAGIAAP
eukprot:Skav210591  [mRNA]  locus=scaffold3272:306797:308276:+ [translate_table: standard]